MTTRKTKIIAISGTITLLWIIIISFGLFDWFDLKMLDFCLNHSPSLPQDTNIVVVEYDDNTAENLSSPTSKLDMAVLVHIIEEQQPRVLVLDLFSLYGVLQREDTTMLFEEVLSQYSNICYGIGFIVPREKKNSRNNYSNEFKYLKKFLYPLDSFGNPQNLYYAEHLFKPTYQYYAQSKSIGHLVLKNDVDGVFRRIPALITCGDGALATLGMQAAFDYLNVTKDQISIKKGTIEVTNTARFNIPVDTKAQALIHFNDKRNIIQEISMIDIFSTYKNPKNQKVDLSLFKDKLVFIGNTSSRTARFCATPLHSYYPTVLIHANVANNVLQHSFLRQISKYIALLFLIFFGVLYTLPMVLSNNAYKTSILLFILIPVILCGNYLLVLFGSIIIPIFTFSSYILFLLVSLIVYRYLHYKNYLLISLKELQEAMRLKERLATIGEVSSKVAHEIRNPLNAIELYTSLLKRGVDNKEEADEHLNIIHGETQRLNRFITRLLGYARPKEPAMKKLNVHSEIHSIIQLLSPDADKKGMQIRSTVPENLAVFGDPDQVHEIFLNLAKNGMEAMSEGGTLDIYTQKEKTFVSIFFKDTGEGISEEDLKKIFNPFFSRKKKGTGLGLALVKKIVEAHHGEILVQSEPGKGTLIEIKLPSHPRKQKKGTRDEKV